MSTTSTFVRMQSDGTLVRVHPDGTEDKLVVQPPEPRSDEAITARLPCAIPTLSL